MVGRLAILLVLTVPASAAPMTFRDVSTGGNCSACGWVQAEGEITSDTPKVFRDFMASREKAGYGNNATIRFNSPGGSLSGGIALGEAIRERNSETEVGSTEVEMDSLDSRWFKRAPGACVSACAYAFLGGVARSVDTTSKLGFHQFYSAKALEAPTTNLFSGKDLDTQQRILAAILLYVIRMGVDPRVVVVASVAGATEMNFIEVEEAEKYRVAFQPNEYKPWRLEPYKGGAVAVTQSADGTKSITVSCSKRYGPNALLVDAKPSWDVAAWFEQCQTGNLEGYHPVLGARISPDRAQVTRRQDGAAVIRFQLPDANPPLTSASFFSFDGSYSHACSTSDYRGTMANLAPTVRLALRNCIMDGVKQ